MGAWGNVVAALGMHFQVREQAEPVQADAAPFDRTAWVPVRIVLADYPQLQSLAWQVKGVDTITPVEAFGIYERNARHVDPQAMSQAEKDLWLALERAFSAGGQGV